MIDINQDEDLYQYTKATAPDNLVVNVGTQTLIVGAAAQIPQEMGRIEIGDRRRGDYYIENCLGVLPGLMRVSAVGDPRLREVEKIRLIRTKQLAPDWVIEARRKAAMGDDTPPPIDDAKTLLSPLQAANKGIS